MTSVGDWSLQALAHITTCAVARHAHVTTQPVAVTKAVTPRRDYKQLVPNSNLNTASRDCTRGTHLDTPPLAVHTADKLQQQQCSSGAVILVWGAPNLA